MLKKTKNIDAYLNQIKDIEESELYSEPSLFNVSNIKEKLDKYIAYKSNVTYITLDENNNFTGLFTVSRDNVNVPKIIKISC